MPEEMFFEIYRFSEDLDFTLRIPEHLDADSLKSAFSGISEWIHDQSGIEIPADKQEFDIYENPRGQISCQGKISYKGPVSPTHALPRIKLDLIADERVVLPPAHAKIFHPYSDTPEDGIEVLAYDYTEAFAEKFRALAERARPRDLYDVVHLYRNTEARPEPQHFMEVLRAKCEFKGIGIPRMADLEPYRAELEAGWIHMLEHQLPALPPWLRGIVTQPLAAMSVGAGAPLIRERVVGLSKGNRIQSLVEMIRFAAANHLLVEIDYCDKQGNRSVRAIEAYSLRRSRAGDVLLMAVRADNGQPRSYLVDSMLGVKFTPTPFTPRYPIELTPTERQSIPRTIRSGAGGTIGADRTWRSQVLRTTRSTNFQGTSGPTYVFECTVCGKTFYRKIHDAALNKHKHKRTGYRCYGTIGKHLRTKY